MTWWTPGFGSGMVKVTPAHDPNDFEMAQRSDLPMLDVMTAEATMSEGAPEAFRGLDRLEARKRVVASSKLSVSTAGRRSTYTRCLIVIAATRSWSHA